MLNVYNEFRSKVLHCKDLMDKKSCRLSSTEESDVNKAHKEIKKMDQDYKQHLEKEKDNKSKGGSDGKSIALQDDENRMRKIFNNWANRMNKIFEKLDIGQVCIALTNILLLLSR